MLIAWRDFNGARVADRFRHAVAEGGLPPGTDPDRLARYVVTLSYGISVQAASGVGRDELQQAADTTLPTRPPATSARPRPSALAAGATRPLTAPSAPPP